MALTTTSTAVTAAASLSLPLTRHATAAPSLSQSQSLFSARLGSGCLPQFSKFSNLTILEFSGLRCHSVNGQRGSVAPACPKSVLMPHTLSDSWRSIPTSDSVSVSVSVSDSGLGTRSRASPPDSESVRHVAEAVVALALSSHSHSNKKATKRHDARLGFGFVRSRSVTLASPRNRSLARLRLCCSPGKRLFVTETPKLESVMMLMMPCCCCCQRTVGRSEEISRRN